MWTYIVVAIALPSLILGHEIILCPGGLPSPTALRIQGCPSSPCRVTAGDEIIFQADLTANEATTTMMQEVEMYFLGQSMPFPLPPELQNVCNLLLPGQTCPLTAGQQVTHSSIFPVITDLHGGIPVQLRSRIYNASGTTMSCSIINAIVD